MQVGPLEETITVTRRGPARRHPERPAADVVSAELLAALPSGVEGPSWHLHHARARHDERPGEGGGGAARDLRGERRPTAPRLPRQGGLEGQLRRHAGEQLSGTGATSYIMNPQTVVETAIETRRRLRRKQRQRRRGQHGPEGRRQQLHGCAPDCHYSNEHLQSDNLTDELRGRGLTSPTSPRAYAYDVNATFGGPDQEGQGCGSSPRRGSPAPSRT